MSGNGALVRVRDLHKVFRRGSERIDVLQGVSLDLLAGDFLALMGPSVIGAGRPGARGRGAGTRPGIGRPAAAAGR